MKFSVAKPEPVQASEQNVMLDDETPSPPFSRRNSLQLPAFPSTVFKPLAWRLWHGINYMFGGLYFLAGSIMYYPWMSDKQHLGDEAYVYGGWLFTIGSAHFLLADLTEWWHFKTGCIGASRPGADLRDRDNSCYAGFKRAEMGINFIGSATGSTLYLLGSIFFIPATNDLELGEWFFIIGSAVIFLAQSWKCYRTACTNEEDPADSSFRCSNTMADWPGFQVDLHAGVGGLMYCIGTILFLDKYNKTPADQTRATHFFMAGASFFTISGLFMQYRYYCHHYPKPEESKMPLLAGDD